MSKKMKKGGVKSMAWQYQAASLNNGGYQSARSIVAKINNQA